MKTKIAEFIKKGFHSFGMEITKLQPGDIDDEASKIIRAALPYTMTNPAKLYNLIQSVRYIVANQIPGDIVECGVWKGGSILAVILTLQSLNISDRTIYLYDTFSGMPPHKQWDINLWGEKGDVLELNIPLDEVKQTILNTKYPADRIVFVPGMVEVTLPNAPKNAIALLRLDTDFYESTLCELEILYDNLVPKGVMILDDYGFWLGVRKAVDEYFSRMDFQPFMSRIDESGRLIIKP
jgi:hypothetical protein